MIVKCVLCENPLCLALIGVTQRQRRFLHGCSSQRHLNVACPFCGTRFALVGGMIGVALGIVVAKSVTALIGMPSEVKAWTVLAGLLMAGSVGVFFGVYPARRAASLDPIQALRFEL